MATASGWERAKDIIGALLFMIVGGVFLREMKADELPAQAAKYPSILIYLIFGLCIILITKAVVGFKSSTPALPATPEEIAADGSVDTVTAVAAATEEKKERIGFATVFVLVLSLLYVVFMPHIGFILSSGIMMIVFMLVMGIRSIPVLVLVPVVEIAFLWYVFEKLLAVFLPDAESLRALLGIG